MGDLRNTRLIYLKGWLFLLCGAAASALLILEIPTLKAVALLSIAVWCFCRFYYFAFYVVQHYVDGEYRFRGLLDFVRTAPGVRSLKDRHQVPGKDRSL